MEYTPKTDLGRALRNREGQARALFESQRQALLSKNDAEWLDTAWLITWQLWEMAEWEFEELSRRPRR